MNTVSVPTRTSSKVNWSSRRKTLMVLLAALLLLASLASVASAAPAETEPAKAFSGEGQLACTGVGVAILNMSGHLEIAALNGGNALIKGAKWIRAEGVGRRLDRGDWTYLIGWRGHVVTAGRDFYAEITARDAAFVATGAGWARVKGHGRCEVNGLVVQLTPEFQEIQVDSPADASPNGGLDVSAAQ